MGLPGGWGNILYPPRSYSPYDPSWILYFNSIDRFGPTATGGLDGFVVDFVNPNTTCVPGIGALIVVDSQVHIWEHGKPSSNHRQQPFRVEDLLQEMRVAQVDRAVLVPPLWNPQGNAYSIAAAASHPACFAVMGLVNLFEPQDPAAFREWIQQNKLLGVRISFNSPASRAHLTSGHADWSQIAHRSFYAACRWRDTKRPLQWNLTKIRHEIHYHEEVTVICDFRNADTLPRTSKHF